MAITQTRTIQVRRVAVPSTSAMLARAAALAAPKELTAAAQAVNSTLQRVTADAQPFSRLGPMSNLKPGRKFKKGEKESGAMYFYTNRVRFGTRVTAFPTYISLAQALVFPQVSQILPTKADMNDKPMRDAMNAIKKQMTDRAVFEMTRVRHMDDGFEVEVPFLWASKDQLKVLLAMVSPLGNTSEGLVQLMNAEPAELKRVYENSEVAARVLAVGGMFARHMPAFMDTPRSGILVREVGGWPLFSLRLKFTAYQASVMCQNDWLLVRPVDFYGMMREWAMSRMGTLRPTSLYSMPLADIAATLPPGGVPRVSDDLSIMVDEKSSYWWLPKEANNISTYEGQSIKHLKRPDGSYCSVPDPEDGGDSYVPKPTSGLVLLDWVNLKMSYVGQEGQLVVRGLDRCMKAHVGHYVRMLKARFLSDLAKSIVSFVVNVGRNILKEEVREGMSAENITAELVKLAPDLSEMTTTEVTFQDVFANQQHSALAKEFFDLAPRVYAYVESSPDNLYATIPFTTVSHMMAWLGIFLKCAPNYTKLVADDAMRLAAYQDRNPDPNYKLPPVPYVAEDRALQPHQFRSASRLRNNPHFAILAVDAGGGKTISCIFDFLKMLDAGIVHRGLILCPAHLVAQYVKEFLYFTDSRVNVIAVNTQVLKSHGIDGITKILESAPPNTVVVTDYDMAKGSTKSFGLCYGPTSTRAYPLIDTLRRFNFDYVFCDESHMLKNLKSGRFRAASRLVSEIPYKRLASGTLTPNTIVDLVAQVNLLDPTIFPADTFESRYMRELEGGKKEWDNVGIRAELNRNVQFIQVKRKEWAAWLPPLKETQHFVSFTPAQATVYRDVLFKVMEKLREQAKSNKKLAAILAGENVSDDDDPDSEETSDTGEDGMSPEEYAAQQTRPDEGVNIEKLLTPYIARLEQFISAPGSDVWGGTQLQGADLVSPKVGAIVQLFREHQRQQREFEERWNSEDVPALLAAGIPEEETQFRAGKILVFCNYVEEAEALHAALPDDIRSQTILYKSANKLAHAAEFEKNDRIQMMIGVEISMNTGLNLQFASRLIRVNSVWTPGALEQGNARIQRPNIKTREMRKQINLDWLVCENSIDILKQAFLLTKLIAIGKFENAGNPRFEAVTQPTQMRMTLTNIQNSTLMGASAVEEIGEAYTQFQQAYNAEFAEYRARNLAEAGPDGRPVMKPISRAPNLPDSKLMYRVPYVPGLDLYGAEALGLVRYDHFMNLNTQDLEDDGEDLDDAEDLSQREQSRQELARLEGLAVHTEYGEGIVRSVSKRKLIVEFPGPPPERKMVWKLSAFIITRKQTNNRDLRSGILKQIGDVPFDALPEVPASDLKVRRNTPTSRPGGEEDRGDVVTQREAKIRVALSILVVNDYVGLQFNAGVANPRGCQYLEALGFSAPDPFFYARIRTPERMFQLFTAWAEAGFDLHPQASPACASLYKTLIKHRGKAADFVGIGTKVGLNNFFRERAKPIANKKTIFPYPLVMEDEVMIALPEKGHPGSLAAMRIAVPSIKWTSAPVSSIRQEFYPTLHELDNTIKRMIRDGVIIKNLDELREARYDIQTKAPSLLKPRKA